ncbi:Holliday junction resolvase RuvX, partial [Candidatus Parcubacteria bacterium]
MRYLGIDYGKARIGLALSDPSGRIAFPHTIVHTLAEVVAEAREAGVEAVVIGLPLSFSGRPSPETQGIRAFAAKLGRTLQLPIEFENEVLTTKIAEQSSGKRRVDASAAALILQSFLDRKNGDENESVAP